MKKILISILILFNIVLFIDAAEYRPIYKSPKVALVLNDLSIGPSDALKYMIKDNEFYICHRETYPILYRYEDGKFETMELTEEETDSIVWAGEIKSFSNRDYKFIITEKLYVYMPNLSSDETVLKLLVKDIAGGGTLRRSYMFLASGGQPVRAEESSRYTIAFWNTYSGLAFFDNKKNKFYFSGWAERYEHDNIDNLEKQSIGIYVYDLKTDKISEIIKDKDNKQSFTNPIRIPNTSYLLYLSVEHKDDNNDKYNYKFYIQEIPEWAEEMKKNKQLAVEYVYIDDTYRYYLDVPANMRDKPNGKIIAVIENNTGYDYGYITMLIKEGDWYKTKYGWTYKENIKRKKLIYPSY